MSQLNIFNSDLIAKTYQPKITNYSYETSLKPYRQAPGRKQVQAALIYLAIKSGASTILELSEIMGLPSSTISGRINDLVKAGKVAYSGTVTYKNRLRKRIVCR